MNRSRNHSRHADAVMRFLRRRGVWCTRIRATWGQKRGLPDIFAVWNGRAIAVEIKTGCGRLTPYQRRELTAIAESGGIALTGDAPTVISRLCELFGEAVLPLDT
ncbi:hypothetical protein HRbin16_03062 [bacterium HR16]|nr:hypothetical protein HRbin16_03062 [bacterium HR16]